jgi:hypothetical protein
MRLGRLGRRAGMGLILFIMFIYSPIIDWRWVNGDYLLCDFISAYCLVYVAHGNPDWRKNNATPSRHGIMCLSDTDLI